VRNAMGKLTRITRDFVRVVTIDGVEHRLRIGTQGLTIAVLGDPSEREVPLRWADLAREGGLLDAAELSKRPLLAAAIGATGGAASRRRCESRSDSAT
jgi:hypothetical protein